MVLVIKDSVSEDIFWLWKLFVLRRTVALHILFQIPGKPNYSVVLYYAADRPVNKSSLLGRFIDGTDTFRDSRFKLIPSIIEVLNITYGDQKICWLFSVMLYSLGQLNYPSMITGILDGQACSWDESLLIGESCNLQVPQTRQFFGGISSSVFFFPLRHMR